MAEWTRFKDKLPEEGQRISVQGQWPFVPSGIFRTYVKEHCRGYCLDEFNSQARLIIREFKPGAMWMPLWTDGKKKMI